MGKISKEEAARFSGADWMLRFVEENGVDAARKELERRGVRQIPLKINKDDVNNFYQNERNNIMMCTLILAASTLHDEFGFSTERLKRFVDRFNLKATCIAEDYISWEELQEIIHEKTGVYIVLPEG